MMGVIHDAWEKFKAMAVPEDADPRQAKDMRLAYYAGAITCLGLYRDAAVDPDIENAAKRMNEIDAELVEVVDGIMLNSIQGDDRGH